MIRSDASMIVPISVPQIGPRKGVNVQSHWYDEYISMQRPLFRHGLLEHLPTQPIDTPYTVCSANRTRSIDLPLIVKPLKQPTKPSEYRWDPPTVKLEVNMNGL